MRILKRRVFFLPIFSETYNKISYVFQDTLYIYIGTDYTYIITNVMDMLNYVFVLHLVAIKCVSDKNYKNLEI